MQFKDYYKVMGVARDASQDEIKRAYRKLARKYHPDVSKESDAEAKFKELQEANEVLKDPEKRAAYDQLGSDWRSGQDFRPPPDWGSGFEHSYRGGPGGGEQAADFSDFFSELFGSGTPFGQAGRSGGHRQGFAATGQDHVARVDINLEDAFKGGMRTVTLRSPELTPDGHVVVKPRTLRVSIPAGVKDGQQIRLAGQGGAGVGGAPAGDLYLEVRLNADPLFQVNGRDVTLTLPVAPWEAALGETVSVPTLGGSVEMKLPVGAKAGQKLRLKGRGLPGSPPGDQYVLLKIVLPPDSAEARSLFEQMKAKVPFDPRAGMNPRGTA